MANRTDLHQILKNIMGNSNVYYNPPESLRMNYPCIRYNPAVPGISYASDGIYRNTSCYELTYIDRNPDAEEVINKIMELPMCKPGKPYMADNLCHWIFTIYF